APPQGGRGPARRYLRRAGALLQLPPRHQTGRTGLWARTLGNRDRGLTRALYPDPLRIPSARPPRHLCLDLTMMFRFAVLLACLAIAAWGSVARPDAAPRAAAQRVTVLVEPVDGTSIPMGKLLAGSVAEELSAAGVPAAMSALGTSPFVLRGRAETNS